MKIDKYKSCRDFIKYIFITLSLSFMIGCDSEYKNESIWVITTVEKLNENYIYTLEDESRFGEGAFKYISNTFLGMPGDTVMLVPKK